MTNLCDPLTYDNLMAGTVLEFERQPLQQLGMDVSIRGPGIYCLIYTGSLDVYREIALAGCPNYVGKAIPLGSRRGDSVNVSSPALQSRIREHARSIDQAENLNKNDFQYRYLAIEPAWITLAERFAIDHYKLVWNRCLDGFGDHDPGAGRYNGEKSWWDTMRPGRSWAARLRQVKTLNDARSRLNDFFSPNRTA